jgi:hypothetical protein
MRQLGVSLVAGAVLLATASPAGAQTGGAGGSSGAANPQTAAARQACLSDATDTAMGALGQSLQFNLGGVGPFGWAPLAQPFAPPVPIGAATMFAPAGLIPTYGPLGPGLTANNIATFAVPPGGFDFEIPELRDSVNQSAQTHLASLQQGELATQLTRLQNGAQFQVAAGVWGLGYGLDASATRLVLRALCRGPQAGLAGPPPMPPPPPPPPPAP